MEPNTDDLSLRNLNMFFVEMESENCISNKLWLKRSISLWLVGMQTIIVLRHEYLQAQLLDYNFC